MCERLRWTGYLTVILHFQQWGNIYLKVESLFITGYTVTKR